MTVSPLPLPATAAPDAPLQTSAPASDPGAFARAVSSAFDVTAQTLERADAAERAFVAHRGGLQEMVLERAQADVALSLASTAASHVAQALGTILGMQV